jgi:hypothetical protein
LNALAARLKLISLGLLGMTARGAAGALKSIRSNVQEASGCGIGGYSCGGKSHLRTGEKSDGQTRNLAQVADYHATYENQIPCASLRPPCFRGFPLYRVVC